MTTGLPIGALLGAAQGVAEASSGYRSEFLRPGQYIVELTTAKMELKDGTLPRTIIGGTVVHVERDGAHPRDNPDGSNMEGSEWVQFTNRDPKMPSSFTENIKGFLTAACGPNLDAFLEAALEQFPHRDDSTFQDQSKADRQWIALTDFALGANEPFAQPGTFMRVRVTAVYSKKNKDEQGNPIAGAKPFFKVTWLNGMEYDDLPDEAKAKAQRPDDGEAPALEGEAA